MLNQKREKHERTAYVLQSGRLAHSRAGTEILQRRSGSIYACMFACMSVVCLHACLLSCIHVCGKEGCTQCVVLLLHSLSLSSGVRVTVGITDTTCALNQEARAPCIQVDRTLTRRAHAKEQPGATGAHCHRGGSAYKK